MNRIKLTPPIFKPEDLRAIVQACALCHSPVSRLVTLLQQIRSFRYHDLQDLSELEARKLTEMAAKLDAEVSLTLYLFLVEAGLINEEHYLDLESLGQQCLLALQIEG